MLTIFVRWVARALEPARSPSSSSQPLQSSINVYQVVIRPTTALRIGDQVSLVAISRVAYHKPNAISPRYDAYDPHLAGTIAKTIFASKEMVVFELHSSCAKNPAPRAWIAVKSAGATCEAGEEGVGADVPEILAKKSLAFEEDVEVHRSPEEARQWCNGCCASIFLYPNPVYPSREERRRANRAERLRKQADRGLA